MTIRHHIALGLALLTACALLAALSSVPIPCELPRITSDAPRHLIPERWETRTLARAYRRAGVDDACRVMEGVTIELVWSQADDFEGCDAFKGKDLRGCARPL